jgi:hypothetical protein
MTSKPSYNFTWHRALHGVKGLKRVVVTFESHIEKMNSLYKILNL